MPSAGEEGDPGAVGRRGGKDVGASGTPRRAHSFERRAVAMDPPDLAPEGGERISMEVDPVSIGGERRKGRLLEREDTGQERDAGPPGERNPAQVGPAIDGVV